MPVTFFGHKRSTKPTAAARTKMRNRIAINFDAVRRADDFGFAGQCLKQLVLAIAGNTGNAHDFAAPHLKTNPLKVSAKLFVADQ